MLNLTQLNSAMSTDCLSPGFQCLPDVRLHCLSAVRWC